MNYLWKNEPVFLALIGSAVFWKGLFVLLGTFGHALTPAQQDALSGVGLLVAGAIARGQVSPVKP